MVAEEEGPVTSWDDMVTAVYTAVPEYPGDEDDLAVIRLILELRARRLTTVAALR